MNARQQRRNAHAVKMAKSGLRKFGKRMSFLMMKPSPLFLAIMGTRSNDKFDGGTYISEPLYYSNGVN